MIGLEVGSIVGNGDSLHMSILEQVVVNGVYIWELLRRVEYIVNNVSDLIGSLIVYAVLRCELFALGPDDEVASCKGVEVL